MRAYARSSGGDLQQRLAAMECVSVSLAGYYRGARKVLVTLTALPSRLPLWTHDNNVGNVVHSVYERVKGRVVNGVWEPTLLPTAGAFTTNSLLRFRNRVVRRLPALTLPISIDQFVDHYRGLKRARYEGAATRVRARGVRRSDSYPSVFLKAEKWAEEKAGRLISARSPEYNICVGRYLLPLERMMYEAMDAACGAPTIMKCQTPEQRAAVVKQHWEAFVDPVAVGQDFSKFDQHISRQALQYEHAFYNAAFCNDPELQKLLSWQLDTKCFANVKDGKVKYDVDGGRMSGDMNTAMGNCIISTALVFAYAYERGITIRAIVDGDDSVAFMERTDLEEYMEGIEQWMEQKGFRLTLETPVFSISEVEFCQCRYVAADPPTMVRNPVKAITQDHAWIVDQSITHAEVLAATGLGGLSLYGNMPVLGAYYDMLARTTAISQRTLERLSFRDSWLRDAQLGKGGFVVPDERTRFAFWESWGISPGEQRALEERFANMDLSYILRQAKTITNTDLHHYGEFYTISTTKT